MNEEMESLWLSTTGSVALRGGFLVTLLLLLLSCTTFTSSEAYDALDPTGNITIKWDVISWTPDGYVISVWLDGTSELYKPAGLRRTTSEKAIVTMYNFQQYRHIQAPGWALGWTWAEKEVIWNIMGGQTTEQGNCSKFKGNIPQCCEKDPTVVDLLPGTPYSQQIANCCKGGVLNAWGQNPDTAISSFQLSVGSAGTTNRTVKLPKNFTLKAPCPGYTCGPTKIVKPTMFVTKDKRTVTQALMTWNVTCTYSQFLAQKTLPSCVSLSSFYNDTIVNCPTCTRGCQNKTETGSGSFVNPKSPHLASVVPPPDAHPQLPNESSKLVFSLLSVVVGISTSSVVLLT